jgi:hypothetical protein
MQFRETIAGFFFVCKNQLKHIGEHIMSAKFREFNVENQAVSTVTIPLYKLVLYYPDFQEFKCNKLLINMLLL